jgi:hypothetical protein
MIKSTVKCDGVHGNNLYSLPKSCLKSAEINYFAFLVSWRARKMLVGEIALVIGFRRITTPLKFMLVCQELNHAELFVDMSK